MVELNIKNDNGVYDLHFRSNDKETVMKVYSSLAKHFNKITEGEPEAQVVSSIQEPHKVYEQPIEVDIDKLRKFDNSKEEQRAEEAAKSKVEEVKQVVIEIEKGKADIDKLRKVTIEAEPDEKLFNKIKVIAEESENELFEENDFKEDYSQYADVELGEESKIDVNKALQSTEEAAKQITDEEKEKAEKRKTFYAKVLYQISKESQTFYSLLSLGYPVGSNGGTLIVNLPNETYKIISEDKRTSDVVSNAIRQVSNNSSVNIKFQPEGDIDMIDKLKNRLDAEKVNEVEILY